MCVFVVIVFVGSVFGAMFACVSIILCPKEVCIGLSKGIKVLAAMSLGSLAATGLLIQGEGAGGG